LRLTGNPVDIYLDMNRTPEQVEALTQKLHLDQPLIVQFGIYLRDVLKGDFGESCNSAFPRSKWFWIVSATQSSWSRSRWGWP
jgi:ABC-type dipeptide/oligopeptide/nickel transport system permease component